jgi:glycosyltransferase involved in cell wall biosynthesis
MYSGNHSPYHPLTTILEAAARVADVPALVFLFIGGGLGKKEVEASTSPNVRTLPYQPLDRIKYSLSAADVHLVALGNELVGVSHPCKIYGALEVARPILFLGPEPSHVSDIIAEHRVGWHITHGDVAGAERLLRTLPTLDAGQLAAMGAEGRRVVVERFGKDALCGRLVDVLERGRETAARDSARPIPAGPAAAV